MAQSFYYKTEDFETGYCRYIREKENETVVLTFGTPVPRLDVYPGRYKKQPGELLQHCTNAIYVAKHYDYLVAQKKAYAVNPIY